MLAGVLWAVWCTLLCAGLVMPRELMVVFLFGVMSFYILAELISAPASSPLTAAASPDGMRSRYLAAFQFSWSIAGVLTPALFTLLYSAAPILPWIAVGCMVLATSAGFLPLESRLPAHGVRRGGS